MKITVSSIKSTNNSYFLPTDDGYSNHVVMQSVEELSWLEEIVKRDMHTFKVYTNDKREGLRMGLDEKNKEIKGPVSLDSMAGIVFDIDEATTIAEFEQLDISKKHIYVIYASKSHMVPKMSGKTEKPACDRFHVFFPFENDSTNFVEIKESCEALKESFKKRNIVIDTTVTTNIKGFIYPSRLPGQVTNEHFFFRVVSENRTFITEEYLSSFIIEGAYSGMSNELDIYKGLDVADAEYIQAVEYLKNKTTAYKQWIAAGTSLKVHFGDDKGLQLWLDLCDNPNYSDNVSSLTSKFRSFKNDPKLEKGIFAVANAIAKESGDSKRFLTKSKIVSFKPVANKDYYTSIEYTGDNYLQYFNSFMGLTDNANVWIRYSHKDTWELRKVNEMRTILKNHKVVTESVDDKGKKKTVVMDAFEQWISHTARRNIHNVVLEMNESQDEHTVNLFTGYNVDAIECDIDGIRPFYDYVLNILSSGNKQVAEYIVNYIANVVQLKKNDQCLVLMGEQGTGKSTLNDIMSNILGKSLSMKAQNSEQLIGRFTSHLANKVLIYMDEALFTKKQDKDNDNDNKLKDLITDKQMTVEYKNGGTVTVDNRLNFIMTTNNDYPVNVEKKDRRFAIIEVSNIKIQNREYFDALYGWLRTGGYEKILYVLQNYTTKEHMDIPETQAKLDAVMNSARSEDKFLLELFRNNGKMTLSTLGSVEEIEMNLSGRVSTTVLYSKYELWCHLSKQKPTNSIAFGKKVKIVLGTGDTKRDGLGKRYYDIDVDKCKDAIKSYFGGDVFYDVDVVSAPVPEQIVEVQAEPVKVAPQPVSLFTEPKPEPQIASPVVEPVIGVQTSTPIVKQAAMTVPATVDLSTLDNVWVPGAKEQVKYARQSEVEMTYDKDTEKQFYVSSTYFSRYYVVSSDDAQNKFKVTLAFNVTVNQCN